jgi:hypothetical protein
MMKRATWLVIACGCAFAAIPVHAQDTSAQEVGGPVAGGGGSASGNILGYEASLAASVKPAETPATPPAPEPSGAGGSVGTPATPGPCRRAASIPGVMEASAGEPIELSGILDAVNGTQITITIRTGAKLTLDAAPAMKSGEVTGLVPGRPVAIMGSIAPGGTLRADVVQRSRGGPADWPPDCRPPD